MKTRLLLAITLVGAMVLLYFTFSRTSSFSTPAVTPTPRIASPQTFIILGDTGTGDARQYKVAEAVRRYCLTKNCKAVFIAGDVIYDRGVKDINDEQFTSKFEQVYEDIDLPFYIAFGNHDYFGCITCYLRYTKQSNKWRMPDSYYAVNFDTISFFVINTENFDNIQNEWLTQKLSNSKNTWNTIVGHRPIETTEEEHGGEQWSGIKEFKQTICQTADYYIAGHAHILEDVDRIDDCKTIQLVSGGGGSFPRKVYPYSQSPFYFEGNGFLAMTVENNQLRYEFLDADGKVLFENN